MEGELDLLLSVAGGLGRWQELNDLKRVYVKDADCLPCLKDLQRFLRRDDPDLREVFFKLGELQLIENDIVPLITTYPTERDLVYHALKVLTFMTMPIDDMTAQVPKQYSILGGIKRSCLNKDLLAALMMLAAAPLNNHPRMSDEDHQTLQLLLTFFRNLVTIPDPPAAAGAAAAAMQARMQDTLLQLMFDESVMELISFTASHCDQRPFKDDAPLLLDLLAEVYAGVEVQEVLDITHEAVQQQQRQQQQRAQAAARRANSQRPKTVAQQLLASHQLTRHGRYKSTIVQKHADTAAVTYIHDVKKTHSLESPQMELETRVRPQVAQKWSLALLLAIKEYTQTLLKGGYNVLMSQLRRELECGMGLSRLEPGDFTKWFQLAAWFCGFVRRQQECLHEDKRRQKQQQKDGTTDPPAAAAAAADDDSNDASSPYGGVSATLGYETFKLTQDNFREQAGLPLRADQKNWSLLHASSLLLREALGVLELACKAGNDADKKAANRMARKLLHDTSELGLLPSLSNRIKTFSARFEPRSAAATLVEALHVVLRLYDRLQAQEDGVFFVKAKKRGGGGGGRRKKVLDKPQDDDDKEEEETAEDKVDQDGNKKDDKQQQKDDNDAQQQQPQNGDKHQQEEQEPQQQGEQAASSQQQQEGSSSRSAANEQQQHERDAAAMGTVAEAAAADSAGKETEKPAAAESGAAAGPTAGKAGEADSREKSQQQEQQQQPHRVADDSDDEESKGSAAAATAGNGTAAAAAAGPRRNMLEELEAEAGSDDEDDEYGYGGRYQEVALNLKARLRKEMAVPAVVHFYVWLLAGYNNWNSAALNHAVVSFLWRLILPEHLNLEPILYQMSVLRLFHQLLSDPSLRGKSEHTSVLRLATTVVRGLFSKLAPPPPAAAADEQQQQQGDNAEEDDTQDPEKQQQAKEREQRRQAAVAGMVAVELLFWTHPDNCDVIAQDYYLKEGERLLVSGPIGKNKRKNAVGDDGLPVPRTLAPLLNPAGEKKLQTFFEKLCADRNNLELLTRQMGGRLSAQHIKQEMKRLGLKFGSLPDSLTAQLHQLWQHHRDQGVAAAVDKIAEELPGGWNAKQVRKLLRTEGLVGGGRGGRRRGGAGGNDEGYVSNDDGWDSDGEGGDVLFDVEKGDLERLYQQYIVEDDYLDKIAAALPFDAAANDVLATLRFHGIVSKPPAAKKRAAAAGGSSRRRAAAGSDARKVTKAQLVELCEEHGSDGDGLNIIAMALGLPVLEVQKLLVKYNINTEADSGPEASTQSKRCPISTDTLQSLYDEFKDSGDSWLESIAEQLPEPATAKQVKAWLKKAGILKAAARKRRERADDDSAAARPAAAAAVGVSEVRRSSAVPEPQPMQLLGYLEALHRAYEDRWMDGPGAVQWLLDKLAAAENVWQVAAAATGSTAAAADYALVPAGDDDLNFFCSDWSNELLMAAGVRNDNGDYFKIPGNSTAAWRERVRAALKEAQDKLGSSEAAAAYELVMEEAKAAAAAEREPAAVAAAADEEARKFAAAQGLGFGSGSQRPAAAAAARGARAAAAAAEEEGVSKRRRKMTEKGKRLAKQKVAAVLESSDDGWDSDDAEQKTQRRRQWQQRKSGSSSSSDDGSDNDDHQDDAMPRFENHDDDDDNDQEHDQKATSGSDHEDLDLAAAAGGGGGSGKKRRLPQKQQQQRKKPAARNDADSDDDESPVTENSKAAAAAVAAKGDSRKRRSSAGEAAAAGGSEQGKAKKRKSGAAAGDDAHETAARRTALQEITRKRQQQQQQQQPRQQQKKMIRLVDDENDDQMADDEFADDDFDDADENRPAGTAAATAAAAKAQAAAAAGGRAGRGAMILLDDDDDDDD